LNFLSFAPFFPRHSFDLVVFLFFEFSFNYWSTTILLDANCHQACLHESQSLPAAILKLKKKKREIKSK